MTGFTAQDSYHRQQSAHFTDLLRASSALHDAVEWVDRARWAVSILLAALALLGAFLPGLRPVTGVLGAVAAIATTVVWPQLRTRWQRTATDVQEQFDSELFGIDRSADSARLNAKTVSRWTHRGPKAIDRPWYLDTQGMPAPIAQAMCQYENTLWDAGLRSAWALTCKVIFGALAAALLIGGLALQLSLWHFLIWVAVPTSSLFATILSGFYQQAATVRERTAIHEEITAQLELMTPAASEEDIDALRGRIRTWQTRIYRSRLSNVRVPSWFHRLHRDRDERDFETEAAHRRAQWTPALWGARPQA